MRARLAFLGLILAAGVVRPLPAWAQAASGTIAGRVTDVSGSAVPGAVVTVTRAETESDRKTETGPRGDYTVPLLPAGSYRVSASRPGFRTAIREGIQLEVDEKARIDLVLEIGPIEQIVSVQGDAPIIQGGTSSLGTVIDSNYLRNLPLNGRAFLQLGLLSPGSAPPAPGSELSTQSASGLHFSGARESANSFLLDGGDNNDWFINRIVVSPSLEFIQEFKLQSSNYNAEFGRNGGAQVLIVTRSGGNRFHASAYDFFRNAVLDARNLYDPPDQPIPQFQRNQFGFFAAGPIHKDRAFFSGSYEGARVRQAITRTARVPTPAEKSGDFSGLGSPVRDPFTGQPFPGNRIPAERLDPIGLSIARLYPDPNRTDPQANLVSTPVGRLDSDQVSVRTDFKLSTRDSLFLRYSFAGDDSLEPFNEGATNLPGFGSLIVGRAQHLVISQTQVFRPTFLHEWRFGFNRLRREVLQENVGRDVAGTLGIPGLSSDPVDLGMPVVVVPGFEQLGDSAALPIVRHDNTFQIASNLTWVRDKHYWKAGLDLRRFQVNGFNHVFARGQFIFQPTFTGQSLGDLLLGLPTVTIRGLNDNPQAMRTGSYNFYLQDDWKARPNLTFNLGLRYEFNPAPVDVHDRMVIFDTTSHQLVRVGQNGVSRSGLESDRNNFAPRFGFNWSPGASFLTTIHGAYGIFYDASTLVSNSSLYFNPPYFELSLFVPSANGLLRLSDPFPEGNGIGPPPTVNSVAPNFRNSYLQHWNLTLDRQLGSNTLARIGYVGSRGVKLIRRRDLNQPPPGPGPVDARRPIPGFANITLIEPAGSSIYHSIQTSLERRFAGGIHFLGAYALSKSIDDASDFLATSGDDNYPQDNSRIFLERGFSNFDLRHRFTFTGLFTLPYGRGRPPAGGVSYLLSDWQFGLITSMQSGFPFTPKLSRDNSNTGNIGGLFGSDRPHLVGDPRLEKSTPDRFFNTDAFVIPVPYTFGNSGRNVVTGPGLVNVDVSLSRQFPLLGEKWLEFRAEFFNLFNTPPLGLPERNADQTATFGKILSAGPARQIQFALRFAF
jgi:Carboxypeptidase regulatory-like domain